MADRPIVVLFHRDLRTEDNPALLSASETGAPVIPLYIEDNEAAGDWVIGGASRWWLHHSLVALQKSLEALGSPLVLRAGTSVDVLKDLASSHDIAAIYMSRGYEPWVRSREEKVHEAFASNGVEVKRFQARLLLDPDHIRTKTGAIYKVYTPFWRALSAKGARPPVAAPEHLKAPDAAIESDRLEDWDLLPTKPDWSGGFTPLWQPGSPGAAQRFETFLDDHLHNYDELRNRPDLPGTSRLSPHFQFGEISPAACFETVSRIHADDKKRATGAETFLKELVWREFSYHLLYHFPHLPVAPFKEQFNDFPWREDEGSLKAWQRGQTGYPIVDAGMRELYATGWMHNRVRMIVGSFLTKNLLLPWQLGEAWFWDCLVDADLASNSASWQWVSGSGADAAPYFRIFNPVSQSERYDPDGDYIRRWVPELAALSKKDIHAPWEAPQLALRQAGVELGVGYPQPIVDHKKTRQRALDAYEEIKLKAS